MPAPNDEIARPSDSVGHFREFAFPLGLVASALVGALATLVIMDRQDRKQDGKPETFALAAARSETVVYRQARPPQINEEQGYSDHPYTEQVEASDDLDDDSAPSIFARAVKTVRFVNPNAPAGIGTVATVARESIKQAMVKVEGLVSLAPKAADAPRKQSIMDQVDDYLWEVYRRIPTKKDGTGDFTWKDPAAAKHMHLALKDYVIGGMDTALSRRTGDGRSRPAVVNAERVPRRLPPGPRLRVQGERRQLTARRQPPHRRLWPWPRHRHHRPRRQGERCLALDRCPRRQIWAASSAA